MASALNNNNKDTCIICGKSSMKSYSLKKCTACDNLIHRRCAQTLAGQDILCNTCLLLKKKKSGNSDTPPPETHAVSSASKRQQLATEKVTPTSNRASLLPKQTLNIASHVYTRRSGSTQSNNTRTNVKNISIANKTTRLSTHNTTSKPCNCTENVNSLLDKWETMFHTKFDTLLDKIQKNTLEHFNYIKNEITSLHNTFKSNKQIDTCSPSTTLLPTDKGPASTIDLPQGTSTKSNNNNVINFNSNSNKFSSLHNHNNLNYNSLNQNSLKSNFSIDNILNLNSFNNINSKINFLPKIVDNNSCKSNVNGSSGESCSRINTILNNNPNLNLNSNLDISKSSQLTVLNNNNNNNDNNNNYNYNFNHIDIGSNSCISSANAFNLDKSDNRYNSTITSTAPSLPKIHYNNEIRTEDQELFISGFTKLTTEDDLPTLALAILRGLGPLIHRDDIINVRLVHTRGENASDKLKFPSLIVRLTSLNLIQHIMSLKRSRSYFSTNDIDHTLLINTRFSSLPPTKIIINSVLSSVEYKHFSSLKVSARSLGFKYVWHKDGRFLVKRKSGDRAHYFTSATELRAIWACYSDKEDTTTKLTLPTTEILDNIVTDTNTGTYKA